MSFDKKQENVFAGGNTTTPQPAHLFLQKLRFFYLFKSLFPNITLSLAYQFNKNMKI